MIVCAIDRGLVAGALVYTGDLHMYRGVETCRPREAPASMSERRPGAAHGCLLVVAAERPFVNRC